MVPLQLGQALDFRSRLGFPAGRAPGIDPSHVAMKGLLRWSGIARANTFVEIINGGLGTVNGSPTGKVDGSIGPAFNTTTTADCATFTGRSTATDANFTQAAIFRAAGINTGFQTYIADTNFAHTLFSAQSFGGNVANGNLTINTTGNTNTWFVSTIIPVNGVPYFAAVSCNGAVANFVATRLDTGQILTSAIVSTIAGIASNGTYSIAGNNVFNQNAQGPVSAAMFSTAFLSMQELVQWAADPWAFWFPRREQEFVGKAATLFFGWLPQFGQERPLPRIQSLDEGRLFFLKPTVQTSTPVFWRPGDGGERPILVRRNDDASPFFRPASPAIYIPRSETGERPNLTQDQHRPVFAAQAPAATPVGISGMAWFNPPPDIRLPPPRWVDDVQAFVAQIASIPAGWRTGDGGERPLIIRRNDDQSGFFVAPKPVSAPSVFWFVPYDQPPYVTKPDVSAPSLTLKPPPPPVGISGMAWWQAIEVHLPPPPPQLDYSPGWDPQFEQQINPPAPTAQFTVSGFGVSLTFAEFFVDVVLTDAPITKRTN